MKANNKKSIMQNLNKKIILSSSESASSHWMTIWSHSIEFCLHRFPETEGQTEAALNSDASVYFLDYFLRNA